jgi:hypothetical protein
MRAREDQKIPVGTDASVTPERQRWTFATQINQTAVEPIHRRVIAALSKNIVVVQPAA